jgi:hypothetical protein
VLLALSFQARLGAVLLALSFQARLGAVLLALSFQARLRAAFLALSLQTLGSTLLAFSFEALRCPALFPLPTLTLGSALEPASLLCPLLGELVRPLLASQLSLGSRPAFQTRRMVARVPASQTRRQSIQLHAAPGAGSPQRTLPALGTPAVVVIAMEEVIAVAYDRVAIEVRVEDQRPLMVDVAMTVSRSKRRGALRHDPCGSLVDVVHAAHRAESQARKNREQEMMAEGCRHRMSSSVLLHRTHEGTSAFDRAPWATASAHLAFAHRQQPGRKSCSGAQEHRDRHQSAGRCRSGFPGLWRHALLQEGDESVETGVCSSARRPERARRASRRRDMRLVPALGVLILVACATAPPPNGLRAPGEPAEVALERLEQENNDRTSSIA